MSRPAAVFFPDNPASLAAARELGLSGVTCYVLSPRKVTASLSCYVQWVRSPNIYEASDEFVRFAVDFARGLSPRPVLFPTEDAACLVADLHHEVIQEHFQLPYPGPGVLSRILDKRSLYAAADAVHVATPKQREITDSEELRGIKRNGWLVKPSCRYRLVGNRIESFRDAAKLSLDAGFPTLLQEAVPGSYENLFTAAVVLDQKGQLKDYFLATKQCEYPEPFGDGLIVRRIPGPGVVDQAVRLLRELGYWGICDIEFKRDARDLEFKVLDANPRPWLWMGLGTRSGHPLLAHVYNMVTGESVRPPHRGRPPAEKWVSAKGTFGFLTRCYRPGRHGVVLPLRLAGGVLSTTWDDWRTFHDPLYLNPSAWRAFAATVAGSRLLRGNRQPGSGEAGEKSGELPQNIG
jgi:D-aspartate ligase